jgi:hypothetical protein
MQEAPQLGTRELAEARKLYRRLKAGLLLNQVAFPEGSHPGTGKPAQALKPRQAFPERLG